MNWKIGNKCGGFSILELLVSIVMMSIITIFTIDSYREFNSTAVLNNLGDDIAISIRLAQTYGLNVKQSGGSFESSYGIHFHESNPTEYVLFQDPNRGAGGYRFLGGGVEISRFELNRGYRIADVCAGGSCLSGSLTWVDIVFDRPEPDAIFTSNSGSGYSSVTITIADRLGETQTVTVLSTGYINAN